MVLLLSYNIILIVIVAGSPLSHEFLLSPERITVNLDLILILPFGTRQSWEHSL